MPLAVLHPELFIKGSFVQPEFLRKLDSLLNAGIADERQAVYLMVGVRKLLEQQQAKQTYHHLNFHCNWAVHTKLSGDSAQAILKQFDAANSYLKTGLKLPELPRDLRKEITNISTMTYFEDDLAAFLTANGLPSIDATRYDGWTHFLHFYVNVISDCPLVIAANDSAAAIESVTVKVELANQAIGDEMPFRVTWKILDRNGLSGLLEIFHSFSLNPAGTDDNSPIEPSSGQGVSKRVEHVEGDSTLPLTRPSARYPKLAGKEGRAHSLS